MTDSRTHPSNPSLRSQLFWPIVVASLVLGGATFWIANQQIASRLLEEFDRAVLARAQLLRSLTAFEEADLEEDEPEPFLELDFESEFLPEFSEESDSAVFQMWVDGETFARSESLADDTLSMPVSPESTPRLDDLALPNGVAGRNLVWRFVPYLDEEWGDEPALREANVAEMYPGLSVPRVVLSLTVSRASLDDTLAFVAWVLGAGMILLVVAITAVVYSVVRRSLAPINELSGQLERIASDRLYERLPEDRLPREVAPLATTMNGLLDRLEKSFEKERRFSRNIAHELRTPIAELRSISEVGERWPEDPQANRQFFGDILQIGNRMDLMVTNLLTMARQESGQIECAWESIDLSTTLDTICRRFQNECEECGIQILLDGLSPAPIMADRVYLDIIAANLVSNAVHHGHGDVRIHVYSDGSQAGFEVENTSDDIEKEDLDRLFDRFWRKQTARTSGRHAGLGLSLVKSLSEVCKWHVQAELPEARRFRIRIDGIRLN